MSRPDDEPRFACPVCQYPIDAPEGEIIRCPECGREWDPEDLHFVFLAAARLTVNSPAEAIVARNRLIEAGIRCNIEMGTSVLGATAGAIWVQRHQVDAARTLLAESDLAGEAWTCPTCESDVPAGFEACWSCSGESEADEEVTPEELPEEDEASQIEPLGRPILSPICAGVAISLVFALLLGHRIDYLGNAVAGLGATLIIIALVIGPRSPEGDARDVQTRVLIAVIGAILAGAYLEAMLFHHARFDPVDFCNQSLGAVVAGLIVLANRPHAPGDWDTTVGSLATGLIALFTGFAFAAA